MSRHEAEEGSIGRGQHVEVFPGTVVLPVLEDAMNDLTPGGIELEHLTGLPKKCGQLGLGLELIEDCQFLALLTNGEGSLERDDGGSTLPQQKLAIPKAVQLPVKRKLVAVILI